MIIVDSHCHLNFPQYQDNLTQVIENAIKNGVSIMQTICTKKSEFETIYKIAESNDNIYASVGLHPHDAQSTPDDDYFTYEELLNYISRPKTIGIGETGLDYYYENSPKQEQIDSFKLHIKAAQETGLPLIVHTRDAEDHTTDILTAAMREKPFKLLIHCFTGTAALAKAMLDIGAYISISGIVTFKKSTDLQETVTNIIPLERMLVETDSPFLAPMPHRGKTNEPANTRLVAEFIANLKNISLEEVAARTTSNFYDLFSKVKPL